MTRKLAIRLLVLALPLSAAALAATGISDSALDDQAEGSKAGAAVPSSWSEPGSSVESLPEVKNSQVPDASWTLTLAGIVPSLTGRVR